MGSEEPDKWTEPVVNLPLHLMPALSALLRNARPRESVFPAGFLVGLMSRRYRWGPTQR